MNYANMKYTLTAVIMSEYRKERFRAEKAVKGAPLNL